VSGHNLRLCSVHKRFLDGGGLRLCDDRSGGRSWLGGDDHWLRFGFDDGLIDFRLRSGMCGNDLRLRLSLGDRFLNDNRGWGDLWFRLGLDNRLGFWYRFDHSRSRFWLRDNWRRRRRLAGNDLRLRFRL
jgi:hypothetical protein